MTTNEKITVHDREGKLVASVEIEGGKVLCTYADADHTLGIRRTELPTRPRLISREEKTTIIVVKDEKVS